MKMIAFWNIAPCSLVEVDQLIITYWNIMNILLNTAIFIGGKDVLAVTCPICESV
jgi:hypothetical protein